MLKKKVLEWFALAIIEYLEENGAELAQQAIQWLLKMITPIITPDEEKTDEVFAAPTYPEGCETFCAKKEAELREILAAAV